MEPENLSSILFTPRALEKLYRNETDCYCEPAGVPSFRQQFQRLTVPHFTEDTLASRHFAFGALGESFREEKFLGKTWDLGCGPVLVEMLRSQLSAARFCVWSRRAIGKMARRAAFRHGRFRRIAKICPTRSKFGTSRAPRSSKWS